MSKKEKRISILTLILSIFLFLCAVINFVNRRIGGAICGLGAGILYFSLFLAAYEKSQKDKANKQ